MLMYEPHTYYPFFACTWLTRVKLNEGHEQDLYFGPVCCSLLHTASGVAFFIHNFHRHIRLFYLYLNNASFQYCRFG